MPKPHTLDSVIQSATELDETIKSRVITLAHKALDEAEYLMEHGDPTTKSRIVSQYLHTFSHYLESKGQNDEIEELRTLLLNLQAAVLGRNPGELTTPIDVLSDEVETDNPHRPAPIPYTPLRK